MRSSKDIGADISRSTTTSGELHNVTKSLYYRNELYLAPVQLVSVSSCHRPLESAPTALIFRTQVPTSQNYPFSAMPGTCLF